MIDALLYKFVIENYPYGSKENTLKNRRIKTNKNGRQHHATCQNYFLIGK